MKIGSYGDDDRRDDEEQKKRKSGGGSYDPTLKPKFAGRSGGSSEMTTDEAMAYLSKKHGHVMPPKDSAADANSRRNPGDVNRSPSREAGAEQDDAIAAQQRHNMTPEGKAERAQADNSRRDALKLDLQQKLRNGSMAQPSGSDWSRMSKAERVADLRKAADLRKLADRSGETVASRLGSQEAPAPQQAAAPKKDGKTDLNAMADRSSQNVAQREEVRQGAQMTTVQRLQSMPEGATLTNKAGITARLEGQKGSQQVVLTDKAGREKRIDAEKAHRSELADRAKQQPAMSQ